MKTYVWTLPTRLIHWLIACFIVAAFLLGEEDELIDWHALAGLSVGFLLLFRIIWGFAGPRYSRFKHFALTPSMASKLSTHKQGEKRIYAGHNLESSWVMLAIYLTLGIVVLSGFIAYSGQEGSLSVFKVSETTAGLWGDIHEGMLAALWILIAVHLAGVVMSFFSERELGAFRSIFTGYKNVIASEARLNIGQKILSVIAFLLLIVFILAGIRNVNKVVRNDSHEVEMSNDDNDD